MKLSDIKQALPFAYLETDSELTSQIQSLLLIKVDGLYGPKTQNALVNFKRSQKLSGGNNLGPTTAAALLTYKPANQILVNLNQAAYVYTRKPTEHQLMSLNKCLVRFSITSKEDIRMFLAQTGHESAGLQYMEEIASGEDYEGREDLGNTQPGDGRRFKG